MVLDAMALPTSCPKCSTPLADQAKFCGKCGAVTEDTSMRTLMEFAAPPSVRALAPVGTEPTQPDVPAHKPAEDGKLKQTMLGFSAMEVVKASSPKATQAMAQTPAPPAAAPPAQPHGPAPMPAPAQARVPIGGTMLGIAAPPNLMGSPGQATAQPQQHPQQAATQGRAPIGGTMLGVAMPGIAPTAAGQAPPQTGPRVGSTMLGVAMPGIAPTHGQAPGRGSQPRQRAVGAPVPLGPIVPAPAPLIDDEPQIAAPMRGARGGVPMSAVAAGLAGVLLLAGILVAILWKGAPPIVARPTLDAQGHEALHLVCEGCPDGTRVELASNKTELKDHQGDLLLATPLVIGDNPLSLQVVRPGMGRNEAVKIVVPVSFRIHADMTTLSAKPPVITIRVEALSSSKVELDGKAVTLDAEGHAAVPIDVTAETTGPSVETRRIDKKIAYVVTHKDGQATKGTLPAAVGIAPLQLDAPTSHAVTDRKTVIVAGQTGPGDSVKVNGEAVALDAAGTFNKTLSFGAGDLAVDVEASGPQLAPRTVHATVRHVDNLDAEAKAAETLPLASYDAVKDDIAGNAGKAIVIEGEIVDTRFAGHQTILVVTDHRGCAGKADPNACLARVLFGGEDKRKKGELVRVFGRVTRAVPAQNGRSVPEIEADFLAKAKGR